MKICKSILIREVYMAGTRKPVDEATQMKVLRLWVEGLSYSQLTERFKGIVSDTTIRKIIKGAP